MSYLFEKHILLQSKLKLDINLCELGSLLKKIIIVSTTTNIQTYHQYIKKCNKLFRRLNVQDESEYPTMLYFNQGNSRCI